MAQAGEVRVETGRSKDAEPEPRAKHRWRSPEALLGVGVFVAAALSRTIYLSQTRFHPDESTVLWMALDAVRNWSLPVHGLVSSFDAFQGPGLVWVTLPFVAVGGGRPEFVIVAFGLLNAGAIAFFVMSAARAWGLGAAAVTSAFTIVGPDAFMSSWVWHPSLYIGAMAVLLGAAIRLRGGSSWWAFVVVAIPGLYALVHYSGFVLYGPAAVAIALSRKQTRAVLGPIAAALALTVLAWGPFLAFEWHRDWLDFRRIYDSTRATGGLSKGLLTSIRDRLAEARFAVQHLGQAWDRSVHLTPLIKFLALGAVVYAIVRRTFAYPVVLGVGVLVSGLGLQIVAGMGRRTDVLTLWLLPLYMLAGWFVAQIRWTMIPRLAIPFAVGATILVLGSIDLNRAVMSTPAPIRLSSEWMAARTHAPVQYDPNQFRGANAVYRPCDPPYGWGSETWYLMEVLHPGDGVRAAVRAHAFSGRDGECSSHRLR